MNSERKLRMFELLVKMGYKEIEVGFPSASKTDYDFVRTLIEEDRIPEDVSIQVLTQSREHLIERTYQAISAAKRAVVHLYNSTSVVQRDVVFRADEDAVLDIAVQGALLCKKYEETIPDTAVTYQYSPESYTGTELEYALRVCNSVIGRHQAHAAEQDDHQPAGDRRDGDPERLCRFDRVDAPPPRSSATRSCCPCTPTTTAAPAWPPPSSATWPAPTASRAACSVTASAPASVDLVTLGLNLFSQGIDPQIDFSDLDEVRRTVEHCNQMPVPERSPYGGDLVFTAFSGSHQDAIKKGLERMGADAEKAGKAVDDMVWRVPYLPVDPQGPRPLPTRP